MNSRRTFVALQGFDLLTTLVAFRMGALEANPLVAHLVARFGGPRSGHQQVDGDCDRDGSEAVDLGRQYNFYAVIIIWNAIVIFGLPTKLK